MKVILNKYCIISRVLFALPDEREAVPKDVDDIHPDSRLKKKQIRASTFFEDFFVRVDERIQTIKIHEAAFLHLLRRRFGNTLKSDGAVAHRCLQCMKFCVHSGIKQGERQKKGGESMN